MSSTSALDRARSVGVAGASKGGKQSVLDALRSRSSGSFIGGSLFADAEAQERSASTSASFTVDFMERLAEAERRDEQSLVSAQLSSAEAMDALILDAGASVEAMELNESFGRHRKKNALYPTDHEIQRLADIFWKSPAQKRVNKADSSLAINQTFYIPEGSELDFPTFAKMIALVQRPDKGKKHSEEQMDGWRASFDLMDADGIGTLTQEKVVRFLARRRRARNEEKRGEGKKRDHDQNATSSSKATELQARVDQLLIEKRQRVAALASMDQAMKDGGSLDELFQLVMALAPPLFGCQRASLWVVRPTDDAKEEVEAAAEGGDRDSIGHQQQLQQGGGGGGGSTGDGGALADLLMRGQNGFKGEWEGAWCSFCKRELFTQLSGGATHDWAGSVAKNASANGGDGGAQEEEAPKNHHDLAHDTHQMTDGAEATLLVNKYSIAGCAASLWEPQVIADCYADPRFDDRWDAKTGFVTRTMLCLPVMGKDLPMSEEQRIEARLRGVAARDQPRCLGVLQLVNKMPVDVTPPSTFQSTDLRTGQEFTQKLASAIEAAVPRMLEARAREKARNAVRRRRRKHRHSGHH